MSGRERSLDVITLGRCSMDLFSEQIGAPFPEIESFSTQVGGSPTNVAIGCSRLGLRVAAVTAVGDDPVGRFVRERLADEGVRTEHVLTRPGRTPLAIVGVEPPARFPLLFYRDEPPDHHIRVADARSLPLDDCHVLLLAGSNLAAPFLQDATLHAARRGREQGVMVMLDLDLRPSLWAEPESYGLRVGALWPLCDLVVGTEEEFWAALSPRPEPRRAQPLTTEERQHLPARIQAVRLPMQHVVLKQGAAGVTLFAPGAAAEVVAGFPVEPLNTVGAGDAFASGLIFGRRQGWSWQRALRFGNGCGALMVTRHGCSSAMPDRSEVARFMRQDASPAPAAAPQRGRTMKMQVANAPCSWGVIENTPGERGAYHTYLDEVAETGYVGTELGDWGFMPVEPVRLAEELAARRLTLVASWVTVRLYDPAYHRQGAAAAVRTARLLAAVGGPDSLIVIGDDHSTVPHRHARTGRIRPADALDEEGWASYVSGVERVARAVLEETGLRSVFHHHGATYVESPAEIASLLERTDPELVGLCFDSGHYALGGGDPVEGLRRHASRIQHVHFKDFDPAVLARADQQGWGYQQLIANGVFSELGTGIVDFPALLSQLTSDGYSGWIVVEQDVWPGIHDPRKNAARNRAYLRRLGI